MKRPEDRLQASVCQYLDSALPRASYWCAIPNGFWKSPAMARIAKATGLRAGAPDLFVVHDGRFLAIELKTDTGKASEVQMETEDKIVIAGGAYTIARSVEAVEQFLRGLDVPLSASVM